MSATTRLALAGALGTAVAFGPARMGFGLFLPMFRNDFALSTVAAGFIASAGFTAFLTALPFAAWLARSVGPRLPVLVGALAATSGFILVATASGAAGLTLGIVLAGLSAGLCWSPFNDAAERVVPAEVRAVVLSVVATGTTFGVVVAAAFALAVTGGALDWRESWAVFAVAGLLATGAALVGVPARAPPASGGAPLRLARPGVAPLYVAALVFGATNAVYLSFAADRVAAAGGLAHLPGEAAAAVVFLAYGIGGKLGLATGHLEARFGLEALLRGIFTAGAASLVLIALAPGSWPGVVASAAMHGAALMMISAVLSFWSLRLFPGQAALGFTAALLGLGVGSVLGPASAGLLATAFGPEVMFAVAALPAAATALLLRPRRERCDVAAD